MESRQTLLATLAARIAAITVAHPLRVGIDGIDAAGKTTLADELAGVLAPCGRPVIRASVDSFHRPRAERYRRFGPLSPMGFYEDTFDYPALWSCLLAPLGPGGDRRYRRAVFDLERDTPLPAVWSTAPSDAILLFDGIFAQRPELASAWDYRIFVQIAPATSPARALERDRAFLGTAETIRERYTRRYLPAQAHYLATVRPQDRADAVIDNDDPTHPRLHLR